MKKSLFLLCPLICSMSLFFTGCTTNEELTENWEKLPNGKIATEKVTLKLNGEATTGEIEFTVKSAQAATIILKSVVDGYSNIPVDLHIEEQAEGAFKLSGSANITAQPTRAEEPAPMLAVNVSGSVSAEGRFSLEVVAEGPGLYVGTYSGDKLIITYSDTPMTGKTAVLDATDGSNVTLLLTDVIPGEPQALIEGITLNNKAFNGTATTQGKAKVEYTGSLDNKVLTLALKVTMNDPSGWVGAYGLNDYETGPWMWGEEEIPVWVMSSAMYVDWKYVGNNYSEFVSGLFRTLGGILLPQVLQGISIEADGNIRASYVKQPNIIFKQEWITNMFNSIVPTKEEFGPNWIPTTGWETSPRNLANWFEKDGKIYIKLNIGTIIETAMPGEDAAEVAALIEQVLNCSPAELKELVGGLGIDVSGVTDASFELLLGWVKNGIPMVVEKSDGKTRISLDETLFNNLLTLRDTGEVDEWGTPIKKSDLDYIWSAMVAAQLIPEEAQMASVMISILNSTWADNVTSFRLGLDLHTK